MPKDSVMTNLKTSQGYVKWQPGPLLAIHLWCGETELYGGELGELLNKARETTARPDTAIAKVLVYNSSGLITYRRRFHYIALMDTDRTPRALPALSH